jgi:hypothetical protein
MLSQGLRLRPRLVLSALCTFGYLRIAVAPYIARFVIYRFVNVTLPFMRIISPFNASRGAPLSLWAEQLANIALGEIGLPVCPRQQPFSSFTSLPSSPAFGFSVLANGTRLQARCGRTKSLVTVPKH